MSEEEAKVRLQAYRAGGEDAGSPIFKAALEKVASDPELAAWFQAEQKFDAVMTQKFQRVPVDPLMKERILDALGAVETTDEPSA